MVRVQRVTKKEREEIVKKINFNPSQKVFLKYVDQYDLHKPVYELRRGLLINHHGFTNVPQIIKWVDGEGFRYFHKTSQKVARIHQIPTDFLNLFKDYVLTGFRVPLFAPNKHEAICRIVIPQDLESAPHYFLKVYDGASVEGITSFIKENKTLLKEILDLQKRVEMGSKINASKLRHLEDVVRAFKNLSKIELKEMLDPRDPSKDKHSKREEDIWIMKNLTKNDLITRIMKEKYNKRVTTPTIDKVRKRK